MEWFKMSATYDTDAAVIAAGEAAEVLFARGLAYCARSETNGFVADGMPERLCPRNTKARIAALVREKLWVRDDVRCGWLVRSWDGWQSELDALAQRRKSDRDRKRKQREKAAVDVPSSRDLSRDGHGTGSGQELLQGGKTTFCKGSELNQRLTDFQKGETDSKTPRPAQVAEMSRDCPADVTRDPRARDREQEKELRARPPHPPSAGTALVARAAPEAPPSDAQPSMIELLITEYRDNSPRGIPDKLAARLAEEIHGLLGNGFTPNEIRHGLGQLRARRAGPALLAAIVDELANTAATPGNVVAIRGARADTRPSTTDQRVAAGLALADRLEAEEAQGAAS